VKHCRPNELEADGFAGYYLRRPNGYNKTSFAEIAAAYEFAQSIGDYQTQVRDITELLHKEDLQFV
jgi:predicted metalloprotease